MRFLRLIAPAMLLVLIACSQSPQTPAPQTAPDATPAATPTPETARSDSGMNQRFYSVTKRLDAGGSFYMYADLKDVLRTFVQSFQPVVETGPIEARAFYDSANQALDQLGVYGIHDIGMSSIRDKDLYLNKCFISMPGSVKGLPALFGNGPHKAEALAFAPASSLVFFQTDFLFEQSLNTVRDMISRFDGPQAIARFNRGLAKVNMELGINLEIIFKSMGDRIAVVADQDPNTMLTAPNGFQVNAPRFALMLAVKDDTLYKAIVQLTGTNGFAGAEQTTAGMTITPLNVPPNPFWQVSPVVANGKNFFIAATHASLLKQMLEASRTGGLEASPEFKQISSGMPTEGNGMMFVSARMFDTMRQAFNEIKKEMPRDTAAAWSQMLESPNMPKTGTYAIRSHEADGIMMISRSGSGGQQYIGTVAVVPVAILAAIAVPNFLEAQTRSKVSRSMADMRSMAIAIESYNIDCNAYPASGATPRENLFANYADKAAELAQVPTFIQPGRGMYTLTTPISYMSSMPADPYSPAEGAPYGYYSSNADPQRAGWIVWSAGPDKKYDLDMGNIAEAWQPKSSPSEMLINMTYDPTNGTNSAGDVWRSEPR